MALLVDPEHAMMLLIGHQVAPMTHWYGQKVGIDTDDHGGRHRSALDLHERAPRA